MNLISNLERATKPLHITSALLESSDGCCSRQGSYNDYEKGNPAGLINWLVVRVVRAGRSWHKLRDDSLEALSVQVSSHMGIPKATNALTSPLAAPRETNTLATRRNKHPTEDLAAIANSRAQVE